MVGEPEVSLKDYVDRVLTEREKRFDLQMHMQQLAVDKAEIAIDKRLYLLNEFRQQSLDEQKKYALKEALAVLETQMARLYGGMLVIGAIGISNLVRMFYH